MIRSSLPMGDLGQVPYLSYVFTEVTIIMALSSAALLRGLNSFKVIKPVAGPQ
jgi:hypothetical protein